MDEIKNENTEPQEVAKVEPTTDNSTKFTVEDLRAEIKDLRAEAKNRRLALKQRENQFKSLLGIDPEEEVDFEKAVVNFKDSLTKKEQEIITKANNRLIETELKTKESDYNLKLLNKLLDRSKILVENDSVEGLQEQLDELEKEYPEIKKVKSTGTSVNPANVNNINEMKMQELRKKLGL